MAVDRALDLRRIDVLAPGDDHVLDPVLDEDIAVRVYIGGVAGVHPAVLQRLARRVGQVPVAEHIGRRFDCQLANLAGGPLGPVLADDLELRPRHRMPCRAHPLIACQIVIARRQHRDGAGGLGHAVALDEAGVGDRLHRLAQQIERDRRGAIEDIFDA